MKNILIAFALILTFCQAGLAQSDPDARYFLQMTNGKMVYTNRMTLEEPFLRGSYLLVNGSDKYKLSDVKWYRSSDGTFKKFSTGTFGSTWYKQEEEGGINVYSRIVTSSNGGGYYGRGMYMTPTYTTTKIEYFQTGDNVPQRLAYRPLKSLMLDQPEGLEVLNQGHKKAVTRTALYGAGAVMLLAGLVLTNNSREVDPYTGGTRIRLSPLVYLGAVTCIVPVFIPSPTRYYRRAITVFNVHQ